ncbi:MAG: hypothetical protein B6242_10135 [Anaerolineaceae bacterium 4572_78]|nr:MAG: hypothetical protein B6242_10135 [Anaerolineaceae bacterium 4572_78]
MIENRGSQIPSPKPLVISLLAILIVCFTIFFTVQLVLHYRSFASRSLDLGNMNQAIWNTLHGRPFHQTNQPGVTNRLSLHVEPILIPISWLYLIYSTPEILFLLQAIVVALGAIPIFALARWKLRNHKLEVCDSWYDVLALLFAFVYLMYPPLQGATLLDFHAVTLAPTFLLATFYYLETRRPIHFAIFAMLAMACKEEISLLIMMMGLYALLIHRQYRWGLVTIILSLTWAYLAVFAIPPMFAGTENQHWNRYQHLGESPIDMVLNIFRQPMLYINHLKSIQAIEYIGFLLMPIAYLALLNPIPLLLGLPSLGINLLSSFPAMQEVNRLIYVAPIVPSVMIASIYGTSNLLRFIQKTCRTGILPVYVVRTGCPHSMIAIGLIILMATVMYHADYGYFPGGGQFRGWEKVTAHHQKAYRIFEQIPPDAKLSAHDRLDPHVSQRETIYIFDLINDADHIVLDVTASSWPLHPIQLQQRVTEFLNDDFGIVSAWDGYLLLARNRSNLPKTLPDKFYDFARIMVWDLLRLMMVA